MLQYLLHTNDIEPACGDIGRRLKLLTWVTVFLGLCTPLQSLGQNQTLDPFAALYAQLDEKLDLGEGRIGARQRSQPKVLAPTDAESQDEGYFKAQSRAQLQAEREQRFARSMAQMEDEQEVQRKRFNAEIAQQCGSGQLPVAYVGMSQSAFENCSPEIRFGGGLTHVISLQSGGVSARLYAFDNDKVHKVYVVNQAVRTIVSRPARVIEADLPKIGAYPPGYDSPAVAVLPGGEFFVLGQDEGENWETPAGQRLEGFSKATNRFNARLPPAPMMWDARRGAWKALPPPPECTGMWHLHTLTMLPDARVLVAGGLCDIPRLANEPGAFEPHTRMALWDVSSRTWQAAPKLIQSRVHHTSSLMPDGSVIFLGGFADPLSAPSLAPLDSTESLSQGTVFPLNPMRVARGKHSATVLADGSLLVIGGIGPAKVPLPHVERWDQTARIWMPLAPMHTPRYAHSATLLKDGRVLVAGGISADEKALNSTELYDPATNTWTEGPPLPNHLQSHSATLLTDGTVMLAGGMLEAGTLRPWIHLWHPGDRKWRSEGIRSFEIPNYLRHRPTLVPDAQGRVLVFSDNAIYFYRPTGVMSSGDKMPSMPEQWAVESDTIPAPAVDRTPTDKPRQAGWVTRLRQALFDARHDLSILALVLIAMFVSQRAWKHYRASGPKSIVSPPATKRSRIISWTVRVVLYGALLMWCVPNFLAYVHLTEQDMSDECHATPGTCLDSQTKLLDRQWSVPERSKFAKPRIPCAFVGVWGTQFRTVKLSFKLNENGTYQMDSDRNRSIAPDAGHWAIQGKYMLWRSTVQRGKAIDINRIVSNDGKHFELIESNGIHSHFDRADNLPMLKCERSTTD